MLITQRTLYRDVSTPFSLCSWRLLLSIYWYLARIRLLGSGAKLLGRVAESRRLSKILDPSSISSQGEEYLGEVKNSGIRGKI